MAVEEVEYYSHTQSNGVSGGVRSSKTKQAPKRKQQAATRGSSRFTSFFQGITLGTVLLIPVGVWCWIRVDEIAPSPEVRATQVKTPVVKGKPAGASAKRKPMRASTVAVPAPRLTEVDMVKARSQVDAEPPPPIAAPTPAATPLSTQIPRVTDQEFSDSGQKKKGVWRTLASPFRGKAKGQPPPSEP